MAKVDKTENKNKETNKLDKKVLKSSYSKKKKTKKTYLMVLHMYNRPSITQ